MEKSRKTQQSANKPVLKLENVCKKFGGLVASKNISLELFSGEVFGLIGPNGSGKTTLLNLISGIYKTDTGHILYKDIDIKNWPSHKIAKLGILRTFQHPRLLRDCDIHTNLIVGADLAAKRGIAKSQERSALLDALMRTAEMHEMNLFDSIEKLSYGQQKLLEIVRALLAEPDVLLLDEPAAGLNTKEMELVVGLIDLALQHHVAVLLIEHSMDLVMSICHRITVLNFGEQIAMGTPIEIQTNPLVIEAYLGGDNSD